MLQLLRYFYTNNFFKLFYCLRLKVSWSVATKENM
jgi:hypothetical protein